MNNLVLFGDSIFANASYVKPGQSVSNHLQQFLPRDWQVSLLAADGATIGEVNKQLDRIPRGATHLVISAGGNDALLAGNSFLIASHSVPSFLAQVGEILADFAQDYRALLQKALNHQLPTLLCTIYDHIPLSDMNLRQLADLVLPGFNDRITRLAVEARVPVLDLRILCAEAKDFSIISPIEPSEIGGAKIARAIAKIVTTPDFQRCETVIYS